MSSHSDFLWGVPVRLEQPASPSRTGQSQSPSKTQPEKLANIVRRFHDEAAGLGSLEENERKEIGCYVIKKISQEEIAAGRELGKDEQLMLSFEDDSIDFEAIKGLGMRVVRAENSKFVGMIVICLLVVICCEGQGQDCPAKKLKFLR